MMGNRIEVLTPVPFVMLTLGGLPRSDHVAVAQQSLDLTAPLIRVRGMTCLLVQDVTHFHIIAPGFRETFGKQP